MPKAGKRKKSAAVKSKSAPKKSKKVILSFTKRTKDDLLRAVIEKLPSGVELKQNETDAPVDLIIKRHSIIYITGVELKFEKLDSLKSQVKLAELALPDTKLLVLLEGKSSGSSKWMELQNWLGLQGIKVLAVHGCLEVAKFASSILKFSFKTAGKWPLAPEEGLARRILKSTTFVRGMTEATGKKLLIRHKTIHGISKATREMLEKTTRKKTSSKIWAFFHEPMIF